MRVFDCLEAETARQLHDLRILRDDDDARKQRLWHGLERVPDERLAVELRRQLVGEETRGIARSHDETAGQSLCVHLHAPSVKLYPSIPIKPKNFQLFLKTFAIVEFRRYLKIRITHPL